MFQNWKKLQLTSGTSRVFAVDQNRRTVSVTKKSLTEPARPSICRHNGIQPTAAVVEARIRELSKQQEAPPASDIAEARASIRSLQVCLDNLQEWFLSLLLGAPAC